MLRRYNFGSFLIKRCVNRPALDLKERLTPSDILWKIIENNKIKSIQDWKNVRTDMLNAHKQITPLNLDAMTISICTAKKEYDLAFSYLNYLKKENINLNLATLGKYLKLMYIKGTEQPIGKEEEEQILMLYDNIRKSHPILDALTLENVIVALCLTKKWHLCEALLDEIRVTAVPTTFVTCALISAAFLNNADDLAWKLFREILERDRLVYTNVYHSYFKKVAKCASKLETLGEIQKLFNFMHEHSLKLDDSAADEFVSSLRKLDVAVNTSVVNRSGVCKCCNGKLQSFDLTEEEFKDLQTYIIKNIIVGKDVFSKTTPEELLRFKHFVSNMDKYDVVIDGLNVGYSAGVKQTTMVFSALVASVVSHFVNRGKKVLVMGRNHMNKWPKKNWRYIQENAEIFLTQDLSQDDPYLLYCALHSGKDTIIITRDLMRNQKFLLKNVRQKLLFERWLAKGKYHLLRVQPSGIPIFREPLPFSSMPQKNGGYWHIPCFVNDKVPGPDTWLCIKL